MQLSWSVNLILTNDGFKELLQHSEDIHLLSSWTFFIPPQRGSGGLALQGGFLKWLWWWSAFMWLYRSSSWASLSSWFSFGKSFICVTIIVNFVVWTWMSCLEYLFADINIIIISTRTKKQKNNHETSTPKYRFVK